MNQKKVLCNISNGEMPLDIRAHKQNYDTYLGLLKYFDQLHIVCRSNFNKTVQVDNIYIHHVKVPKSGPLRYMFSILRMYFKVLEINSKYDISVLNASEPTTGGVVCSFLKWKLKKDFLLEVQGEMTNIAPSTVGYLKSKAMKYITFFSANNATHIRTVSDIIKQQLIKNGFDKNKLTVVYPRIKLDDFNILKYTNTRNEICNQYDIKNDKKIFLFVGRLVIFKGLKYLLEAISKIENDDVFFLIAGDGDLKDKLENQAVKLDILNKVKFIGSIPYENVPNLMSASDYFILPSVDEGFGRVVIEAMAMKLIVLSSEVGGIKDIVDDEKNGFFFKSENASSIVDSINKVLKLSNEDLANVRENGYEKVYQNYEYSIGMKKYIAIYRNLLNDN